MTTKPTGADPGGEEGNRYSEPEGPRMRHVPVDPAVQRMVEAALEEDVRSGDRTTLWTVPPGLRTRARIVAKEELVVAGGEVVVEVFRQLAPALEVLRRCPDGSHLGPGDEVARLEGSARAILTGERTALNFLGLLSGVASLTWAFVSEVKGTGVEITDTRKTTPGLRGLEKAAVRAGGGSNHRMGLYDMVLIKENHIAAAGGIRQAVAAVRKANEEGLPVEVEVARPGQVEALEGLGVDRLLLDNMTESEMEMVVRQVRGWDAPRPLLEASGNMTLDRVGKVARTGVDLISVGALTHSAPSSDLSLLLEGVDW
jgi:nicotinate-nucleotide pyrophosphorylase (carboxylating)